MRPSRHVMGEGHSKKIVVVTLEQITISAMFASTVRHSVINLSGRNTSDAPLG